MATLEGDVAYITGAASGFGLAIARELVSRGGRAIMVDITNCESIASELNSKVGGKVVAIAKQVDTRSWEQQLAAYEAGKEEFGRVDYFFANAGISEIPWLPKFDPSTVADHPITKPDTTTLDINLNGQINTAALALQVFERQTPNRHGFRGKLVMTASIYAFFPSSVLLMYPASKAAVLHFTKSAALLYAGKGITVNAICPGMTATNIIPPQLMETFSKEHLSPIELVLEQFMSLLGDNPDNGRAIATHGLNVWDEATVDRDTYEVCRTMVQGVDQKVKEGGY